MQLWIDLLRTSFIQFLADTSADEHAMHLKIGRTDDVPRRIRQWNCRCGSKTYDIHFSRKTKYQIRLEKLLLLIVGDMAEHRAYQLPEFPAIDPPERSTVPRMIDPCTHCEYDIPSFDRID